MVQASGVSPWIVTSPFASVGKSRSMSVHVSRTLAPAMGCPFFRCDGRDLQRRHFLQFQHYGLLAWLRNIAFVSLDSRSEILVVYVRCNSMLAFSEFIKAKLSPLVRFGGRRFVSSSACPCQHPYFGIRDRRIVRHDNSPFNELRGSFLIPVDWVGHRRFAQASGQLSDPALRRRRARNSVRP